MKKKAITIISILVIIFIGIIVLYTINNDNKITNDEKKFKKEYESLNTKKTSSNKKYLSLDIPKQNNIKYLTAKETIKKLKKGTSIIYFGFPECPWCRNLVPTLLKTNKEYNMTIYYFNALSIRDNKHLSKDGKIITDKKGTKEYYEIVKLLQDFLPSYEGLNDESIKRLYFPTVVFVKDGEVIAIHTGTIEEQKDPYKKLTKKQEKKLENKLEEYFDEISNGVCEKDAKC